MTRQEANREILKLLAEAVEAQPDTRFGQLLRNIGVVDETKITVLVHNGEEYEDIYWRNAFYIESTGTLDSMNRSILGQAEYKP